MPPIAREELGRLYRRHAPALRLYARQWVDGGEDLVHDAFVVLARQVPSPARVLPWLYRVVRNAALADRRAAARRRRREAIAGTAEAWFSRADDRLDAAAAARMLAELSLEQREVIVARLWGGLTFDEVAQLAGCSLPTAHRRYQAGLTELQKRLTGRWTRTPDTPTT
jgi:RNA polymerase sigma-70 factor (ECF subfamily)